MFIRGGGASCGFLLAAASAVAERVWGFASEEAECVINDGVMGGHIQVES